MQTDGINSLGWLNKKVINCKKSSVLKGSLRNHAHSKTPPETDSLIEMPVADGVHFILYTAL